MASKKKKQESDEDVALGVKIYGDNAVKSCEAAMEAGLLSYDEAGEDRFWARWIFYKKRGDAIYPSEDYRARWFTEASLFAELWGEKDFSKFYTPEVPMSVAEYKEQKALSSGNVRQRAGSVAVTSGSSVTDGKTIGGLTKQEWFGRQPPTAPRAMQEKLLGPERISSRTSYSGGDLAAGLVVGAANSLVPNETECKCTCKCCLARCTGAGAATTTMASGTEVKDGRPAVETATLPLSNQMKRNRPTSPDGCSTYTLSQAPKRLRRDGSSSVDRGEVGGDRMGAARFGVRPSTSGAYFDRSQGPARDAHANDQSTGHCIKAEVKEDEEEEVKIKSEPEG